MVDRPPANAVLSRVPILLVDDTPANLLALEALLDSPDHELVRARSGQEALEKLHQHSFAVVLLDVQMPGMDGFETAVRIREFAAAAGRLVPILLVTANDTDPSRIVRAYRDGAADFMQKPLIAEIVRAKVAIFVQLHRAREQLREEQLAARPFRLLVESVKDYAIFVLDPHGHVATWNPGAERIKGYTASEIIGQHFSVFSPPADAASGKLALELDVATREGRFEEEGWRVRKDGSRFWANVTLTALRDSKGVLVGFAKVTQDLTQRKAAEEEARRFRLLVESVKDYAIFILDPHGRVATWNPGAQRIKGYAADEIIGKHFSAFYPADDIAAGKCEMELEVATREGRFEEEGWRIRKDGSRLWANVTITALRDPDGTLVGFAKVTRDLTERRATEERLRHVAAERAALEQKAQIQEFQERFIAILGHDLRNPLAAMDMGASILRMRAERARDASMTRVLDGMQSSSRRMSRMIAQILDLTRTRLAGGLQITPVEVDLRDLLTRIVDELRVAHPMRTIELRCPRLSGAWDADRLEQVFSNLIGNALHYGTPDRPVVVEATGDDVTTEVTVHNDGPAIPEELQAVIFTPFRRGERDSRKTQTAGLGLGLYISHEIVATHGGELRVRSTAAEGTTFLVTLPRAARTSSPQ